MSDPSWSSAERYEAYMGRWSRRLATEVVRWMDPAPGLRWADIGCGTGALSHAVLVGAAPGSLVGIDPSAAYVGVARSSTDDGRATFQVGDAGSLPLPEASVDEAVSGLVLNFVLDPVAALGELQRVVAPGGAVTVYVWDYAEGMQMLRRFWDAAVAEDPAAAELDEGSRFALCRPGGLEAAFMAAGLADLRPGLVEIPTVFRDFDDYWLPFLSGQGPATAHCAALDDQGRELLRSRLERTLPAAADGSIRLVARAWVVRGTRPSADG